MGERLSIYNDRYIVVKKIGKWELLLRLTKRPLKNGSTIDIGLYIRCQHNNTTVPYTMDRTHVLDRKIPKSIRKPIPAIHTLIVALESYIELTRSIQGHYNEPTTRLQFAYNQLSGKLELEYAKNFIHCQHIIYNMLRRH